MCSKNRPLLHWAAQKVPSDSPGVGGVAPLSAGGATSDQPAKTRLSQKRDSDIGGSESDKGSDRESDPDLFGLVLPRTTAKQEEKNKAKEGNKDCQGGHQRRHWVIYKPFPPLLSIQEKKTQGKP